MGFIKGFKHDLFISYAHADNEAELGDGQWVTAFVATLEKALRQRLGAPDSLAVYFDHRNLHANHQLVELLDAVRSSAIFVAVASRSYANRPWTKKELEAFASCAPTARLFAVECLPLDDGQEYPKPLDTHKLMRFWKVDHPRSAAPIPLSLSFDAKTFFSQVHDLAETIRLQMVALVARAAAADASQPNSGATTAPSHRPLVQGGDPPGCVLLAQVTDDLEGERDSVRRYLEQFGTIVLPDETYPQGGAEFTKAFELDLARSDVFVQLLGPMPGRRPPDLPKGYTQVQYDLAVHRGGSIIQWRQPDLVLGHIADADHKKLLSAETVIMTGMEAFKAELIQQMRRQKPKIHSTQSGLVFIDADRNDLEIAKVVQSEFRRHRLSTVMPSFDGPAEAVRQDLEENLIECDALVLVYGDTTPLWIRGQLRLFNKIKAKRNAPPRVLAIYTGPPTKTTDLGISISDTREINCGGAWAMEPLREIIEEMTQ